MVDGSEMCVIAVKVRVNALIKRASLFIQQCKDPSKDPELSFADFSAALELDPDNADIYHHRGQVGCSPFFRALSAMCLHQVHLLIDETNKAIVDFSRAVSLQPNFPVAHVQKLYTDYRAATTIGRNTDRHHIALDHFL